MNRRVVALTVACLATIFVSINAHARNDAFDGKGNLFVADADRGMIFKFTPDGRKSMFASGLVPDVGYGVAFDRTDNLFVSDEANDLIFKFRSD
jgi:sugar lactone lactonase YvrE